MQHPLRRTTVPVGQTAATTRGRRELGEQGRRIVPGSFPSVVGGQRGSASLLNEDGGVFQHFGQIVSVSVGKFLVVRQVAEARGGGKPTSPFMFPCKSVIRSAF